MLFEFRIVPVDGHPDDKDNSGNEYRNQEQCIESTVAEIKIVVWGNKIKFDQEHDELENKDDTNEISTAFVSKGATAGHLYLIFILQVSGLLLLLFVAHHFLHIIIHYLNLFIYF